MYEKTDGNNTINLKKKLYFNWINLDWFTFLGVNDILKRQIYYKGERQECKI